MKAKKIIISLLSVICLGVSAVAATSCEEEHVHEWNEIDRTNATCTEAGTIKYLCAECEEVKEVKFEEAKGHTEMIDAAVVATCTTTGLTEGKHCSECGEVTVAQVVIPTTPHTEVIDAAVVATCTTTGLTEGKHCSECGEVTVAQEFVAVQEHNYNNYVCIDCEYNYYTSGLNFYILNTNYVVSGYEGTDTKVVIPSIYKGKRVTTISNAFGGCESVTDIIIPDSVTWIQDYAFTGCRSLTNIAIPQNVTRIGEYAFYNCSSLTSIIIPERVTTIERYTFYGCSSLTSIIIPENVTTINEYAFYECWSLTSITIPENVTRIERSICSPSLTTVYYTGTKEQWDSIYIDSLNDSLRRATIVYNYKG